MKNNEFLKIHLTRPLRRSLLRGHPWVYKEALAPLTSQDKIKMEKSEVCLCQVSDSKGPIGWAMYDPYSPLSLRMLSTGKSKIPNVSFYEEKWRNAFHLRKSLDFQTTNAFRLFNGEGDLLPGLVADIYADKAILQFDGQGPSEFWDKNQIAHWILKNTPCTSVFEKKRKTQDSENHLESLIGTCPNSHIIIQENHIKFAVDLEKGQKTGFFLDQRDNRQFVRNMSRNKTTLNLFSYTGGFSVYAGLGGAVQVTSVDLSSGAIELARENWQLNGLNASLHHVECADVFDFLKNEKKQWEHVIVDPPSMSHSEKNKKLAQNKYIQLIASSAQRVTSRGQISLSSCSSHITFDDFFEIVNEGLSQARRTGQILRVSGQGFDHPFPHICPELRYLKFLSLVLD